VRRGDLAHDEQSQAEAARAVAAVVRRAARMRGSKIAVSADASIVGPRFVTSM
jgi:hypothetical protein